MLGGMSAPARGYAMVGARLASLPPPNLVGASAGASGDHHYCIKADDEGSRADFVAQPSAHRCLADAPARRSTSSPAAEVVVIDGQVARFVTSSAFLVTRKSSLNGVLPST